MIEQLEQEQSSVSELRSDIATKDETIEKLNEDTD